VIDFSDYIKILYNPNQRVDVRIYKKSARWMTKLKLTRVKSNQLFCLE
jgi:hypothetical protein